MSAAAHMESMTLTAQPRQPRGIPAGGQFSEHARDDDALSLDAAPADESTQFQFRVPSSLLPQALTAIKRANARLKRAGIDARFDPEITTEIVHDKDTMLAREFSVLTVERPRVGADGWEFAGAFDQAPNGSIVPRYRLDETIPTPVDMRCDECGSVRARERVYIVRHEDGTTRQVGKSCMELSLGFTPKGLWALTWEPDLDAEDSDFDDDSHPSFSATSDRLISAPDLLAIAASVSEHGNEFVGARNGTKETPSTLTRVLDTLNEASSPEPTAKDQKFAADVLAWVESESATSDYIDSLKSILGPGPKQLSPADRWVKSKHAAVAVSAVSAYRRAHDKKIEQERTVDERKKEYLAPAGTKVSDIPATVVKTIRMHGDYGPRTMVEMVTDDGHTLTWWATGEKRYPAGQKVSVKGTVKGGDVFRDIWQTVLTRAKVIDPATGAEPDSWTGDDEN